MKTNHYTVLIICLILAGCFYDETPPSDQNIWPVSHPTTVGMRDDRLLSMDSAILVHPSQSITSMVIIKDGDLVFENYYFGNNRRTIFDIGGISSSIANLALGRAIALGLISSSDDSLYKYLPAFAQEFEDSPLKKNITFEHLMEMKSGLSWNEFTSTFDGSENDIDRIIQSDDWVQYLLSKPVDAFPGRRYSFNTAISILIAAAIANEYGESYQSFLANEVYSVLDIQDAAIEIIGSNSNAAWGISMTTLDLAKIGYLYLNQGDWFGNRVVDQNYITTSTETRSNVDFFNNFGWLWWRYSDSANFLPTLEENDIFFSSGNGNQRLYVIPHLDMVVAITGEDEQFDFSLSSPFILRDYILNSLQ